MSMKITRISMPVNTSSPSVETQARRLLTTRGEGSDWRMDGSSVALWQVDQHACCAHGRTVESLVLPWLNRSASLMRPRGGCGAGQQMRPATVSSSVLRVGRPMLRGALLQPFLPSARRPIARSSAPPGTRPTAKAPVDLLMLPSAICDGLRSTRSGGPRLPEHCERARRGDARGQRWPAWWAAADESRAACCGWRPGAPGAHGAAAR